MEKGDSVVKDGFYDVETGKFEEYPAGTTAPNSDADYCGQCDSHTVDGKGAFIKLTNGAVNWSNGKASCDTAADED